MLIALLLSTIITLSVASPFHKYPYVFLLDVGNEELQKTNTEQLRVSIPGGSLAMKYPVLGEGDTICHVRVSGIDFGTDLKVNIVDGGPGYKYVVLVFMGNPGISYDAVVTLDTLPNGTGIDGVDKNEIDTTKMDANSNSYQVSDPDSDDNDEYSGEQSMTMKQYSAKSNSEVMQSSSTYYNYAKDATADRDSDEESKDTSAEEQDNNYDSEEDEKALSSNKESSEDEVDDDDDNVEKIYFRPSNVVVSPRAEQYTSYIEDSSSSDDKPADIVDDSLYEKYQALKPHFGDGFKIYPQSFVNSKQYQVNTAYDKEDPVELEQMFNDEEVHNDAKYSDDSNSIDTDYEAAEY